MICILTQSRPIAATADDPKSTFSEGGNRGKAKYRGQQGAPETLMGINAKDFALMVSFRNLFAD